MLKVHSFISVSHRMWQCSTKLVAYECLTRAGSLNIGLQCGSHVAIENKNDQGVPYFLTKMQQYKFNFQMLMQQNYIRGKQCSNLDLAIKLIRICIWQKTQNNTLKRSNRCVFLNCKKLYSITALLLPTGFTLGLNLCALQNILKVLIQLEKHATEYGFSAYIQIFTVWNYKVF